MINKITYCRFWFRGMKKPIDILNESEALAKHNANKSYTALIGDETKPSSFVEMLLDKEMVGVGFLDEKCREYLTYQFQILDNKKIFLSMVIHREFKEETDKVSSGTSYIFSTNGKVTISRETFDPHLLEEAESQFNPETNFDNIPEFGNTIR